MRVLLEDAVDLGEQLGERAFGKIENQSLLDALLCLSRVVVPIARCFSSDSYGGSVMTRSTDAAGSVRSHATASPCVSWNLG